jgi:hypothetical protein
MHVLGVNNWNFYDSVSLGVSDLKESIDILHHDWRMLLLINEFHDELTYRVCVYVFCLIDLLLVNDMASAL